MWRKGLISLSLGPSSDFEALGFTAAQCLGWVSAGESEPLGNFFPITFIFQCSKTSWVLMWLFLLDNLHFQCHQPVEAFRMKGQGERR